MFKEFFSKFKKNKENTKEILYYSIDKKKYVKTQVPKNMHITNTPCALRVLNQNSIKNDKLDDNKLNDILYFYFNEIEFQNELEIEKQIAIKIEKEIEREIEKEIKKEIEIDELFDRSSLYSLLEM